MDYKYCSGFGVERAYTMTAKLLVIEVKVQRERRDDNDYEPLERTVTQLWTMTGELLLELDPGVAGGVERYQQSVQKIERLMQALRMG